MTLPVVILAGGLATRLGPITKAMPKSLIEVAGEPFIFHQLKYLRTQGIKKIILCVGHLGEMIQQKVGDGKQFKIDISYSFDGSPLLGTGGAIKKAVSMLEDAFFVLYGDSYLPIDFKRVEEHFYSSSKSGLMTIFQNFNQLDRSNVSYADGNLIEYCKDFPSPSMSYIDYGLGILRKKLFTNYSRDQRFDLSEVYHVLSKEGDLEGFVVERRFYEIGSHQGLQETNQFLLKQGNIQ